MVFGRRLEVSLPLLDGAETVQPVGRTDHEADRPVGRAGLFEAAPGLAIPTLA